MKVGVGIWTTQAVLNNILSLYFYCKNCRWQRNKYGEDTDSNVVKQYRVNYGLKTEIPPSDTFEEVLQCMKRSLVLCCQYVMI